MIYAVVSLVVHQMSFLKNGQIANGVVSPRKNVTISLFSERKPAHSQHAPAEEHVGFSFGTQMVQSQVDDNYCTRNNKTDAHTNREHADNVTLSDAQSRSFWSLQCANNAFQSPYSCGTRPLTTDGELGTLKAWRTDVDRRIWFSFCFLYFLL